MDSQFNELEITLLKIEGKTIPQIANLTGLTIGEVVGYAKENLQVVMEDSDEFFWEEN